MPNRKLGISRIRMILRSMVRRCYNPNQAGYEYYGARGIGVCDEWLQSPDAFIQWALSNGYSDDLEIDRYPDNDGNYEPRNCRWANRSQQEKNKRQGRNHKPKAKTQHRGVWPAISQRSPWRAAIRINGKLVGLGSYSTEDDAARAYDSAAREYFGKRANLNFPLPAESP